MTVVGLGTGSLAAGQSVGWRFWWPGTYNGPQFVQAEPLMTDAPVEVSDVTVTQDSGLNTWVYSFTVTNHGAAATNYAVFACSF